MLPTFVIGLREGLEAALIVSIIAAFLRQQGRKDLLRWVFVGVATAVAICVGIGVTLNVISQDLPQKQQEGMETVIGVLAVAMVTYMVVWMRRHSRDLKGQLEGMAAEALGSAGIGAARGARAMVLMAFLAVLREGIETVVFLLAVFNNHGASRTDGQLGVVLGLALAVALGYGIYRGGVRLNLSKFFRGTGLVLVLVAAGLVVNALHTAHEAGWLNIGQGSTIDLTWLVRPGSVQSSLLTGMLGVQPYPVVIEVVGWLAYLIPVACCVAWPPGRGLTPRRLAQVLLGAGAALAAAAVVCLALAPSAAPKATVTGGADTSASLVALSGDSAVVRTALRSPAASQVGAVSDIPLRRASTASRAGVATDVYRAVLPGDGAKGRPDSLTVAQIAQLNGGRLPLGVRVAPGQSVPVTYADSSVLTVWVQPRTRIVVDLAWTETVSATLQDPAIGAVPLDAPIASSVSAFPSAAVTSAAALVRSRISDLNHRSELHAWAVAAAIFAVLALLAAGSVWLRRRPRPARIDTVRLPVDEFAQG